MNFNAITEDFVQFVWKFSLFSQTNLYTSSGERIQVVSPGEQNFASGPDFFKSKIIIDDTLWVGTVEIHLSSKEWKTHKHEFDEAYNNLILHVVFEGKGEPVILQNKREVPTLIIGDRMFKETLRRYTYLQKDSKQFIPCEGVINSSDAFLFHHLYEVLVIERLQRKISEIEKDLLLTQGDIDAAFNSALFKHFGSPLNKGPFEVLSRSFTLQQLSKHCCSQKQLESFLFGLANLLHNQDAYAKQLANEFAYIQKLQKLLIHCGASSWKFGGIRPANFPTKRLAQLSALLYNNPRPFQSILKAQTLDEIYQLLEIELSEYWMSHYSFGKKGKRGTKALSKPFKDKLIINVFVPFLFFYGRYTSNDLYVERSFYFLNTLSAEQNTISKGFKQLGFPCKSALDTQALIQLRNEYCQAKRCLECKLGYNLLKKNKDKTNE